MLLGIAAWVWAFVIAARLPRLRRRLIGGICYHCSYDCRSLLGTSHKCPECGSDISDLLPLIPKYAEKWKPPSVWSGFGRVVVLGLMLPSCCLMPIGLAGFVVGFVPVMLLIVFVATTYSGMSTKESCLSAILSVVIQFLLFFVTMPLMESQPLGWACVFMPSGGFGALIGVAICQQYFKERLADAHRWVNSEPQ